VKVLVTGGAGFIGSHVAEAHLANGDDVVIVDDLSTGRTENVPAGATFLPMDITSDAMTQLIMEGGFDVINHHAAHMELRVSVDKPMHDAYINVLGSVRILEAARHAGVSHLVLASTAAVLGEMTVIPADEEHPVRPISPYGVSKRSMELYADYYRVTHGLSISTLRYTNVYGPRQNPDGESGVIAIFLKKFLQGATATIHGDGTQVRDYLYASDAAKANVLAAQHRLNDTYMVCSNTEASVNDVVDALRASMDSPLHIVHGPAKPGDPPRTRGTYARFATATGWKPDVMLDEGIKRTVDSFAKSLT
jgi:UDP-glucose 4-epimerase